MSDLDSGVGSAPRSADEPAGAPGTDTDTDIGSSAPLDLDVIERDLREVESALARLADGTYFPRPGAQGSDPSAPGWSADTAVTPGIDGSRT
jgi:hypothetical protein